MVRVRLSSVTCPPPFGATSLFCARNLGAMTPEALWSLAIVSAGNGGGGLLTSVALMKGFGGEGLKACAVGLSGFLPNVGFAPSLVMSMVGTGLQFDQ